MKIGVLVYVENDNNFLMMKRNKKEDDFHEGYWVAPGGKRKENETIREAAKRELEEETGLISKKLKFMGFLNFPDLGDSPFMDEWLGFVFICSKFEGNLLKKSPEGELKWIKKNKMLDLDMWEGDYIFTELLLNNKKFDIQLTYRKNNLINKNINII